MIMQILKFLILHTVMTFPDKSTTEAQAMLQNYPDIDAIISPTTVGILAAAKVIQDMGSDCKSYWCRSAIGDGSVYREWYLL